MRRMIGTTLVAVAALCAAASSAAAGTISLAWDPVSGATGYRVYYGTSTGNYSSSITTGTASATISGLQDCSPYFVAVKAYNAAGESAQFSNELTGWSRPVVTSATPASAIQGDQIVMDIMGSNFQPGAVVDLGNPQVILTSISVLSCSHVQLLATIEPTGPSVRPAQIGKLDVVVSNPDDVFGLRSQGFEVLVNQYRFDINRTDSTTTNRIDGKDTVFLSRNFAISEADPNYNPDDDFDGNGWIDGADLAYIASNLGRCWSAATKSWLASACPAGLQ